MENEVVAAFTLEELQKKCKELDEKLLLTTQLLMSLANNEGYTLETHQMDGGKTAFRWGKPRVIRPS